MTLWLGTFLWVSYNSGNDTMACNVCRGLNNYVIQRVPLCSITGKIQLIKQGSAVDVFILTLQRLLILFHIHVC